MLRAIATLTAALVLGLSALGGAATAAPSTGTGYPAGQCTAYVASELSWIPSNWGDADTWLIDARGAGLTTLTGADVGAVQPEMWPSSRAAPTPTTAEPRTTVMWAS